MAFERIVASSMIPGIESPYFQVPILIAEINGSNRHGGKIRSQRTSDSISD
jgi:hypothetical protein